MKTKLLRISTAILFLFLPIFGRTAWFYRGSYQRTDPVAIPNYQALALPQPSLSTPAAKSDSLPSSNTSILIDFTHGNYFKISEIDPLISHFNEMDIQFQLVNSVETLGDQLRYATAFIVIAPSIAFNSQEIKSVEQFISRGGRLLVIADPTRNIDLADYYYASPLVSSTSSVDICNLLLASYRITINDDYIYNVVRNDGNFRNVIFNKFKGNVLTQDLKEITFYSAHSIKTEAQSLILGDSNTASSLTDMGGNLNAAAISDNDQVLVIGDLSFMTIPYNLVSDNQQFIMNIVSFLTAGSPLPNLSTMPYLFTHPVIIYHHAETVMDNNLFNSIARIQSQLKRMNIEVEISAEADKGKDIIFLTIYPPGKEYEAFLMNFGLEFSSEPLPTSVSNTSNMIPTSTPFIDDGEGGNLYSPAKEQTQGVVLVPGLGKFPTEGTGLIMFVPGADQNTLTLMAASPEALTELVTLVFSDYPDLSGCLVQDNLAVCRLYTVSGISDGGNENDTTYYDYNAYPTEVPGFTETPYYDLTPTPSG